MGRIRARVALAASSFALFFGTLHGSQSTSAGQAPPSPLPSGARDALDYAFRFASSIRTDPKDMGTAQERVLLDFASVGAVDEAIKRVDQVVGWHRGVVYAEVAANLAAAGHRDEAKALLAKADMVRQQTKGWEGPRISSHIAKALAVLGDVDASRSMASELAAADDQYAGLPEMTQAMGLVASGGFDAAMTALERSEGETASESASWRAEGYLEIARQPGLTREQRERALDSARRVLDSLPGWTKAGALQELGESYRTLGDAGKARAALESAERLLVALPDSAALKGPMVASLARAWGEAGRADHARALLEGAETGAPQALVIDRPVAYASIAAARFAIGDGAQAAHVYGRALDATASLQNSRPRALAAVEVCRSIGSTGMALDAETRGRLDLLFQGLGDPW